MIHLQADRPISTQEIINEDPAKKDQTAKASRGKIRLSPNSDCLREDFRG